MEKKMLSEFVENALLKGSNISVKEYTTCLKHDFGKTLLSA